MNHPPEFVPPPLTPLDDTHDVSPFDCGEPSLDSWLKEHAFTAARRRLGATHVWAADGRVVAYVTISAGLIGRDDLPKALGRGYPDRIPVFLLGRLALTKDLHGRGLGGVLLAEILGIAARHALEIAAAFVVVDALHEKAADFYVHHGFSRLENTSRLALKVATIPLD